MEFRPLFFSGGSAINGLAKIFADRGVEATYLISGFDSGGSSAMLRQSLNMPAIGDIRSRMLALLAPSQVALQSLLNHRLQGSDETALRQQLDQFLAEPAAKGIATADHHFVCFYLNYFLSHVPTDFQFKGACVGNLVLAGAYLKMGRRLDHVTYLFSQWLNLSATIRVISLDTAHLVAFLDNAGLVVGQHRFTGKARAPLQQKIERLSLSATIETDLPVTVATTLENQQLIRSASIICYPPGSFFSSVIANLLPKGVAEAITANQCCKVYIPNLGHDPEQWQLCLIDQIKTLLDHFGVCSKQPQAATPYLDTLLIDSDAVLSKSDRLQLQQLGISLVFAKLKTTPADIYYNNQFLADALQAINPA